MVKLILQTSRVIHLFVRIVLRIICALFETLQFFRFFELHFHFLNVERGRERNTQDKPTRVRTFRELQNFFNQRNSKYVQLSYFNSYSELPSCIFVVSISSAGYRFSTYSWAIFTVVLSIFFQVQDECRKNMNTSFTFFGIQSLTSVSKFKFLHKCTMRKRSCDQEKI